MSSIRDFKKTAKYAFADLIEEVFIWEIATSQENNDKSRDLVDRLANAYFDLIKEINKNAENKKEHYRALHTSLTTSLESFEKEVDAL
ncbi:MAG: hypothetical protein N4A45_12890 [Flavobacteriales bacterium]|jgi:hypothetical protein|nr:hypothetical protein [Flavobacteriales bacterium]